jgi:hypothetical protein
MHFGGPNNLLLRRPFDGDRLGEQKIFSHGVFEDALHEWMKVGAPIAPREHDNKTEAAFGFGDLGMRSDEEISLVVIAPGAEVLRGNVGDIVLRGERLIYDQGGHAYGDEKSATLGIHE